jgi:branched-chain amino acid aminotransferase
MEDRMPQFAFFGGAIVPIEQAKVSIMTHALNYGTGCFEGIRGYWNDGEGQLLLFRAREHFERMHRSARILLISIPHSPEELGKITAELLRREGYRCDVYVRPLAYKCEQIVDVRLNGLADAFAIYTLPFGSYMQNEEGTRACVSSWRRIDDNAVPARAKITGAYINSALAKSEAVLNGFDEALVMTDTGHISEGSAANFFLVRKGQLITPPVSSNIVEGITRATIVQLAREELGVAVEERSIDRSEVYTADEAFFCGTGVQIAAVVEVDHRPVGSGSMGPLVRQLRELYFSVVHGQVPKYRHWCTPVYPQR